MTKHAPKCKNRQAKALAKAMAEPGQQGNDQWPPGSRSQQQPGLQGDDQAAMSEAHPVGVPQHSSSTASRLPHSSDPVGH